MAYSTGTDDNTYSSPPYHESGKKAALRYLAGALAGLGGSALRPGANFGQSLGLGFVASRNQFDRARQAAQDYAQQQAQQEIQRQNAATQEMLAKGKDPRPWYYQDQYRDDPSAQALRDADAAKGAKTEKDVVAEAEKVLGRKLTPTEREIKAGVYREPPKPEKKEGPSIKDYGAIQSNFVAEPTVKTYGKIRDSYQVITDSAKLASGFGDMAMITAYAKALDADTGVKEQEFNNASEAVGYLQKVYNKPNNWFRGTRLTPEGRGELLKSARALYQARKKSYDVTASNYRRVATKYGVDPTDIIFDYGPIDDGSTVPPVTTVPSHGRGTLDSFLR